MIESLKLDALLDLAKKAGLEVRMEDELVVWTLNDNYESALDLNEDGNVVNFTFISGAEVSSDEKDDLLLVNAINAAFVNDGDFPACSACIDIYTDESEEEAIILRASQSLKGGIAEARLTDFFEDCKKAIDILDSILYGEGDEEESND